MAENVSAEELEALVGSQQTTSPEVVSPRDFRQPRRLSGAQQQSIRTALTHRLPEMEADLSPWLRGEVTVDLIDTGEATARDLFTDLEEPMAVLTFTVDGVQGWIIWDNDSALRSVTTALGSEVPEELESRLLSPMETGLVTDAMEILTGHLGDLLGIDIQLQTYTQTRRAFLSQHDEDPGGDPQRLSIFLELASAAGKSPLRIYLPGILPERPESEPLEGVSLPDHLGDVPVELSVVLAAIEVELRELADIEVGDVIPLGVPGGSPVEVHVEGNRSGSARWGQHEGRLAVTIEHLEPLDKEALNHD